MIVADVQLLEQATSRQALDRVPAVKPPAAPILRPGQNCWRVAEADRASVLIDGAAYFANLEAALRKARRSILIIGWDFDGSIRLRPDVGIEESPQLGPLLRSLVNEWPDLEVRILVWSVAVVHAPGAPGPLIFGADWQDHPRLQLRLDTHHPLYAAHHQKIVCIDDSLAFIGGMDLTVERWDTSRHACDDPTRLKDDGTIYEPVHDLQMAVDGDAARAIAEVGYGRWKFATGEELAPAPSATPPWPDGLVPDFRHAPVAIARTYPAWGEQPAANEAAALTLDALSAAKKTIYIEAQYMTAPYVGDVLERRLADPDGPEVVVVQTHESHGWAEELVMGTNRDRLIRRLRRCDHHGRLRVYYPVIPNGNGGECQVLIHSKLIIVDDVFVRIGSSNLNNRSIGLDSECDAAIEATTDEMRRTIVALRNRLLAEHLDVAPKTFDRALYAHGGSVIAAVEELNTNIRGLRAFQAMTDDGPAVPAAGTGLLDPLEPFDPLSLFKRSKE
ncbi:phospholipase D-like domain-containing protein [Microvirga lotononidis]|uniref:Phospholipase D n=1 Tax=Microvirga lotononidis TaxID=864069 RepID=I4YVZ5_9HYPH|nr:phospholipase D-like domain-containing protein [Microvirga lotononidis]EIM28137.1 phosphatidylserine/phosphatidylglycerophosphate/cardiolipin synthase [Microvirga lotononidis]WQO27758.1 phospholipase D-like domain-containing protein [Microvirga lotononidis]